MVFEPVLQLLNEFGFFRVVLPFLLIFSIFYAILLKTKVLGTDESKTRGIATVIAMAAAFMVIAYTPVIDALALLIPQASFLLVVILLFIMMIAFVVPDWDKSIGKSKIWIGLAAVVLLMIFLGIIGTAVGEQIPALHAISQFLIGITPVALTTESINMLIAFGIVIGIPLIVVALVLFSGKSKGLTGFEIKGKED